jgi:sugar phosphate isomerase/epimerase
VADPAGWPVALQFYTVREPAAADFEGTLRKVAAIGYQEVELHNVLDRKPADVRRALREAGLGAVSAHFGVPVLREGLPERIAFAQELGLQFMVCPFPGAADADRLKPGGNMAFADTLTLDDWKWNADLFNRVGEAVTKAGMRFCYHNHHIEFREFGGVTALDVLLRRTDPKLVGLELDLGWVKVAGRDPAALIGELTGRVELLHVKDVKPGTPVSTRFTTPLPFTELGRGTLDWPAIFAAARKAKVARYYVEQDTTDGPPLEAVRISREYLRGLKVG